MSKALTDKVAIVTGSGNGLGEAIARRFAAEGARVVVSDIDPAAAERVSGTIDGAICIPADVTDEQQVQELVNQTKQRLGDLHIMVPNAGVGFVQPIAEMSLADWRRTTAVNLDGVFLSIRYAAPAIIESGGGAIVTISSITSTAGSPLIAAYAAAKAAVRNLTETAAIEFREHGIRINAVLPGFIDTHLVTAAAPHFEAALGLPDGGFGPFIAEKQGRYGTPEEVAAAVTFFASEQASWCTGSSLVLDGGMVASLL
ncbi:glucose 1-dehydrogenase [Gordonia oryzae]|uniref:Glucose 1-dehydrogenase n=2 Tax=Gordonia oryzae TaxID=2487349 RepID=A0A3N4G1M7_9ACTN|nr:glucose 1-dehydrogenase [Gordonia oryzae]RPA56873.1 glucose 1-dehydrogenase [Gordonia oryzae]